MSKVNEPACVKCEKNQDGACGLSFLEPDTCDMFKPCELRCEDKESKAETNCLDCKLNRFCSLDRKAGNMKTHDCTSFVERDPRLIVKIETIAKARRVESTGSTGKDEIEKILRKAIDHYGKDNQVKKSVEEMAELTKALCKGDLENIKEEIADVHVMLWQLQMIFYDGNELPKRAAQKLKRLEERTETDK